MRQHAFPTFTSPISGDRIRTQVLLLVVGDHNSAPHIHTYIPLEIILIYPSIHLICILFFYPKGTHDEEMLWLGEGSGQQPPSGTWKPRNNQWRWRTAVIWLTQQAQSKFWHLGLMGNSFSESWDHLIPKRPSCKTGLPQVNSCFIRT